MTKLVKKANFLLYIFFLLHAIMLFAFVCCGNKVAHDVKKYTYRIENRYPHDTQSYTQGLFIHDGILYESAGQYKQSRMCKIDLPTGEVMASISLQPVVFAEGACVLNNIIYQLSWQEQTCFMYDLPSFQPLGELHYEGEGWGLTTDGVHLIMSDGSSTLKFLNPANFAEMRYINVTYEGMVLPLLNELEYIEGEIWANVYTKDYIVRIDPANGKVTGVVLMNNLLPAELHTSSTDVLNGIAYDTDSKKIYVTGKNWAKLYEITVVPILER